MPATFIKDPQETLDFAVDWTAELARVGDTIASVAWAVPSGITQVAAPSPGSGTVCTIWLAGGTANEDYAIACRITTTAAPDPRIYERTITIKVRQQ